MLLIGFVAVVMSLCGLLLLATFTSSTGTVGFLIGLCLAALPLPVVIGAFRWLDRYEPEPRGLLLFAFFWGATVAALAAAVLNTASAMAIARTGGGSDGLAATAVLVAPWVEEAAKGAAVLLILVFRRSEFDGVVDGIVLAGLAGVGFAFTENILYLAAAWNGTDGTGPGGTEAITTTFVLRCLFSPFAHPLFTAFTGIGVGIAVAALTRPVRFLAPLLGYFLAVVAHATWNTSTVYGFDSFVGVYLLLMVPAFVAITSFAVWSRRYERRMLTAALGDAAHRGLIPATDIGWVVDLGARRRSRAFARQHGGKTGERAMRDYQQAAIELGFLHHRFLRGTPPPDFAERGQQHVERIRAVRPSIAFPGQVVPTR
jgi:RsiW-degrading membrane proteinase PrsW (M82 family)